MVRLREAPSEEQQSTKHKVQSSKVDAGAHFKPAGRLSRSCLAEERRGLHTCKSPQIGVVQKVERLPVQFEAILLRRAGGDRRRRRTIAAADADDAHLRSVSHRLRV